MDNHPKIGSYQYNIPSPPDKESAYKLNRTGYIDTPNGVIKLFPNGEYEPAACE